jgi:hypothetical protein
VFADSSRLRRALHCRHAHVFTVGVKSDDGNDFLAHRDTYKNQGDLFPMGSCKTISAIAALCIALRCALMALLLV